MITSRNFPETNRVSKMPLKYATAPVFALIFLISACSSPRDLTESGAVLQTGEASWYGPGFHGQQTANGETYDQYELTAAHRTLPFDTIVEVKNQNNGKSVRVRVNDRGPYVDDRVIDLSKKAAEEIDMVDSGIAPVELILVEAGGEIRAVRGDLNRELYTIQIASFYNSSDAEATVADIGRGSRVEQADLNGDTVYRVFYGNYERKSRAERALRRLSRRGYDGFIKQVQN